VKNCFIHINAHRGRVEPVQAAGVRHSPLRQHEASGPLPRRVHLPL
jgi:hypothetical protein